MASVKVSLKRMDGTSNIATFVPSELMKLPSLQTLVYKVTPDAAKVIATFNAEKASEKKTVSEEQAAAAVKELQFFNELLSFCHTAKIHEDGTVTIRFSMKCEVSKGHSSGNYETILIKTDSISHELLEASDFISAKINGAVERQMSFHCSIVSQMAPSINNFLYEYTPSSDR